ncbi:hypothetical protein D556_3442 [Bordetella holmesii 41130]|nr:hypothetical protein D556_3442 [Bordetella holmesii 41130]
MPSHCGAHACCAISSMARMVVTWPLMASRIPGMPLRHSDPSTQSPISDASAVINSKVVGASCELSIGCIRPG